MSVLSSMLGFRASSVICPSALVQATIFSPLDHVSSFFLIISTPVPQPPPLPSLPGHQAPGHPNHLPFWNRHRRLRPPGFKPWQFPITRRIKCGLSMGFQSLHTSLTLFFTSMSYLTCQLFSFSLAFTYSFCEAFLILPLYQGQRGLVPWCPAQSPCTLDTSKWWIRRNKVGLSEVWGKMLLESLKFRKVQKFEI